jgi:hypothetical protein
MSRKVHPDLESRTCKVETGANLTLYTVVDMSDLDRFSVRVFLNDRQPTTNRGDLSGQARVRACFHWCGQCVKTV